jgi:hypothetical protein
MRADVDDQPQGVSSAKAHLMPDSNLCEIVAEKGKQHYTDAVNCEWAGPGAIDRDKYERGKAKST